jgi:hypothetical protein
MELGRGLRAALVCRWSWDRIIFEAKFSECLYYYCYHHHHHHHHHLCNKLVTEIQILPTINMPAITSKFRTVAMFVITSYRLLYSYFQRSIS